jgi:hypothetical protein
MQIISALFAVTVNVMRKSERSRPYPPDFVDIEELAYRLCCGVRTVRDYVDAGILPRPIDGLGNLVRWRWRDVEDFIIVRSAGANLSGGETDEYSAGIVKIEEAAGSARRRHG